MPSSSRQTQGVYRQSLPGATERTDGRASIAGFSSQQQGGRETHEVFDLPLASPLHDEENRLSSSSLNDKQRRKSPQQVKPQPHRLRPEKTGEKGFDPEVEFHLAQSLLKELIEEYHSCQGGDPTDGSFSSSSARD